MVNILIFIGLLVGLFVARWLVVVLATWYMSLNELFFNSGASYFSAKFGLFLLSIICFAGVFVFASFILSWGLNFLLDYKISLIESFGVIILLRSVLFISKTGKK